MTWKKKLAIFLMCVMAFLAAGAGFYLGLNLVQPASLYRDAEEALAEGQYDEAVEIFTSIAEDYDTGGQLALLGGFDDAADRIPEARYRKAVSLREQGDWDGAIELFTELGEYSDSADQISNTLLCRADEMTDRGAYAEAIALLETLGDYDGGEFGTAQACLDRAHYAYGQALEAIGKLEDAAEHYALAESYSDAWENLQEVLYNLARNALLLSDYDTARDYLMSITAYDYEDVEELLDILESAVDRVYQVAYTDSNGISTSYATTYLWVHSVIVPGQTQEGISVKMQEDLVIGGELDAAFFGAGSYEYILECVRDEETWYFTYYGSESEDSAGALVLEAAFSDGYTNLTTRKVYVSERDEEIAKEAAETAAAAEEAEETAGTETEKEAEAENAEEDAAGEPDAEDDGGSGNADAEDDGESGEPDAEDDGESGDTGAGMKIMEDEDDLSGATLDQEEEGDVSTDSDDDAEEDSETDAKADSEADAEEDEEEDADSGEEDDTDGSDGDSADIDSDADDDSNADDADDGGDNEIDSADDRDENADEDSIEKDSTDEDGDDEDGADEYSDDGVLKTDASKEEDAETERGRAERTWTEVEDEELAELVREGFRTRIRVELAESGNMAFYNDTDDARLPHYCSVGGCLREGEYVVTDSTSRQYYCSEHYEGN